MFGFISKNKLHKYIKEVKDRNRKERMGANYNHPINERQQNRNLYAQAYEDGTDNMYNALCSKFNLKRNT
jgi:hypothetical protein